PRSDSSHVLLARALAASGELAKSVREYDAALRVDPNSVDALSSLAILLATSPERPVRNGLRAVELAERAMTLTRGADGRAILAAVAAYAETDQFERAISVGENFSRSAPPNEGATLAAPLEKLRRHERIRIQPTYP